MERTFKYDKIISTVCEYYGINPYSVKGKSRLMHYVKCRYLCYWYIRMMYRISYKEIGQIFGRDHTTVLNGIRVVENSLATKMYLYPDMAHLNKLIMPPETTSNRKILIEFNGNIPDLIRAINKTDVEVINYEIL